MSELNSTTESIVTVFEELVNNDTTRTTSFSNVSSTGSPLCASDSSDCKSSPGYNQWHDPHFVVAVVCFILGGILLIVGLIRVIWFLSQPKRRSRTSFPYVIRYTDPYQSKPGEQFYTESQVQNGDNQHHLPYVNPIQAFESTS